MAVANLLLGIFLDNHFDLSPFRVEGITATLSIFFCVLVGSILLIQLPINTIKLINRNDIKTATFESFFIFFSVLYNLPMSSKNENYYLVRYVICIYLYSMKDKNYLVKYVLYLCTQMED